MEVGRVGFDSKSAKAWRGSAPMGGVQKFPSRPALAQHHFCLLSIIKEEAPFSCLSQMHLSYTRLAGVPGEGRSDVTR